MILFRCPRTLKLLRLYTVTQCRFNHNSKGRNDISKIRNIGILAHIDAGKTTTTERLLYYSGEIKAMGEVHKGNTVTDFMEEERERGITIRSACVTFTWRDHIVNLVDTPGHIDFTAEVEAALGVMDGGVVVLDAQAGVEVQTVTVWRQADQQEIPRLVYANKMDRPNADLDLCANSLREKLGVTPLILHIPLKDERQGTFSSIVDLLTMRLISWSEGKAQTQTITENHKMFAQAMDQRNNLIDQLSSFDDKLAEFIVSSGSFEGVSNETLKESVRKCTLDMKAVPLICGSSYKNVGVELLLDSIIDFLPSPLDSTEHVVQKLSKNEFVGKAFKVMHEKQRGPLVFFRVYSGEISRNQKVFNLNNEQSDQVGYLYRPFADELTEVSSAKHGDFVCSNGMKFVQSGDIICNSASAAGRLKELGEKHKAQIGRLLKEKDVPKPVVFCSVEPPSQAYQTTLERALSELSREDPSLQVTYNDETGQTVLGGMGELHLEIIKDRLLREYKIDADIGPVQILYKEKPLGSLKETHQLKNVIGSTEMEVSLTLSLKAGKHEDILRLDMSRESAQNLAHLTHKQIAAIKQGVLSGLSRGPLLACEVIDCHAVLHHIEMNKRVPEPILIAAAAQCVNKILKTVGTQLLEPVMEVTIIVDESLVSHIQMDLSRRRGEIIDLTPSKHRTKEIIAEVPLAEIVGYAQYLRSTTSGTASFSIQFKDYKEVSSLQQEKILSNLI